MTFRDYYSALEEQVVFSSITAPWTILNECSALLCLVTRKRRVDTTITVVSKYDCRKIICLKEMRGYNLQGLLRE